jgi:protein-S-isoprenylcysteine O-methyltransferase Ste14
LSEKGDVKSWDKTISSIKIGLSITILGIAGLNYRSGWLPDLPTWGNAIGAFLYVFGYTIFVWAMATNTFFSRFVRIQEDRGHTVVTNDPYQYVRHPGYAGGALSILGVPLLLGSLWALIPKIIYVCLLVVRTALEDHSLVEELAGYECSGPTKLDTF